MVSKQFKIINKIKMELRFDSITDLANYFENFMSKLLLKKISLKKKTLVFMDALWKISSDAMKRELN